MLLDELDSLKRQMGQLEQELARFSEGNPAVRQDQSGYKNRLGRITHDGSATVRCLLTEAAWQATRRSPTVRAYFERMHKGDKTRRKTVLTITSHHLVRAMWSMLVK